MAEQEKEQATNPVEGESEVAADEKAATALAEADPDEEKDDLPPLNVQVESTGPSRRVLTIEVPQERIQARIAEAYKKLATDATVPGFRRGKVPRNLIEKRFGATVKDNVKAQVLSESYSKAIDDNKLEVIGEPEIDGIESLVLPESGSLTFKVDVEVLPQVTLPAFETLSVTKAETQITEEDVAKELDNLRTRFGHFHAASDHPAGAGDFLQANLHVRAGADASDEAEELLHQEGLYVMVPSDAMEGRGHVGGIVVPDLFRHLDGRKAGEQVRISQTGPTGHEDERIRDQPITLVLDITGVEHLHQASLEDLAKRMSVENVSALESRVRKLLEARREQRELAEQHRQVQDQLLERVELELPAKLTGRQTARLLQRTAMELAYQGVPEREIEQRLAELRTSSEDEAKRQLKLFFILDQAARNLEVEIKPEEINGRIASLAMSQGRRPERLRQEMQRNGQIESLYLSLREEKTLDQIVKLATIKDAATSADENSGVASASSATGTSDSSEQTPAGQ